MQDILFLAFLTGVLVLLAVVAFLFSHPRLADLTWGVCFLPYWVCLLVCWNGLYILASLCWFCAALGLVPSGLAEAAAMGRL
jgi:hypothetical protein